VSGAILKIEAIEINQYTGEGYQPLMTYGEWRVAALRYDDSAPPDQILTMERHTATDEVFILTQGNAILIIGGTDDEPSDLQAFPMKASQIYNVKKNAWHTTLLSRDANIIIVENDNTSKENSETQILNNSHLKQLKTIATELPI
jgi:ureidoglycolate hydrolase